MAEHLKQFGNGTQIVNELGHQLIATQNHIKTIKLSVDISRNIHKITKVMGD